MILVESLESLIHNYLEDPTRPGSATSKVNAQDLVSHIAQHLAERGVDVGFQDGSRLTLPGSTSRRRSPHGIVFLWYFKKTRTDTSASTAMAKTAAGPGRSAGTRVLRSKAT